MAYPSVGKNLNRASKHPYSIEHGCSKFSKVLRKINAEVKSNQENVVSYENLMIFDEDFFDIHTYIIFDDFKHRSFFSSRVSIDRLFKHRSFFSSKVSIAKKTIEQSKCPTLARSEKKPTRTTYRN